MLFRKSLLIFVTAAFLCALCAAQDSGSAKLQVRLKWADENQASLQALHVELLTVSRMPVDQRFSDDSGNVSFGVVSSGGYVLRVTGDNAEETFSSPFEVFPREQNHVEYVRVKYKGAKQDPTSLDPSVSAVQLNVPGKARHEYEKGSEALEKKDYEEAKKRFQRAVEIYPKFAMALNYLGVLAMNTGDPASGEELFSKAIAADPKCAPAYVNRAKTESDFKKAEEDLGKAITLNPSNVEAMTLLAMTQLQNHEFEQALLNSRKVHTLPHVGYASVHLAAGNALEALQKPQEAVEEYKLFLTENPTAANAPGVRERIQQISRAPQ